MQVDDQGEALPESSSISLYSPGQVAGATFLGSPIAGCILLAANYRALERQDARKQALVCGVAATVVLLVVAVLLPPNVPASGFALASTLVLYQIAKMLQGKDVLSHLEQGGAKRSNWRVVGIGVACLVGVLVVATLVMLGLELAFPGLLPE